MRSLLAVGCVSLVGPACHDGVCTLVACDSGATLEVGEFPEPEHAALQGAMIEVCLNEDCVTGTLDELPMPNDIVYKYLGSVEVALGRTHPAGSELLEIEVRYRSGSDAFTDGDVYRVELQSTSGTAIVTKAWRAPAYVTVQPNGPDCSPTCRYPATLEPIEPP